MNDYVVAIVMIVCAVVFVVGLGIGLTNQRVRLDQYDDTIAEYMMCIKYNTDNTDGDCSDIILSEYGEEVE